MGYGIWNTLLARHAASAVVPFTMLVPVVGMLTAWLILAEMPTPAEAGGGALLFRVRPGAKGVNGGAVRLNGRYGN